MYRTVLRISICIILLMSVGSVQAEDTFKLVRVFQNLGNAEVANPSMYYSDSFNPARSYQHAWIVQIEVLYQGVSGGYIYPFVTPSFCGVSRPSLLDPYAYQIKEIMWDLLSTQDYADLSDGKQAAFSIMQAAFAQIQDEGQTIGYALSYENAYSNNCQLACGVMDIVLCYMESEAFGSNGSGIPPGDGITQAQVEAAIKNALEGLNSYYVPPTLELPYRGVPMFQPSWERSTPVFYMSPPAFEVFPAGNMGGTIEIPVLGQIYYFDWSSQLMGWASGLDTYRIVFRYMMLTTVVVIAFGLVWTTLRQL